VKVLLAHKHITPDVTTHARMLSFIGSWLHDAGHEVTIFGAMPSYNGSYGGEQPPRREDAEGVAIVRTASVGKLGGRRKQLEGVLFALRLAAHLARPRRRYDVISITTAPPVMVGVLCRLALAGRRTKVVYHCQDLQPEASLAAKVLHPGIVTRAMRRIDRATCTWADRVVVLSADMRATVAERGATTDNVAIINNFNVEPDQEVGELDAELKPEPGLARLVFTGNIGRFQGLENLVDAMALLRDEPVELVLMGNGAIVEALRQRAAASGARVRFVAHQPVATVYALIKSADLGVVSLAADVHRSAYPSKTITYLFAGCPLLVVADTSSQLVADVLEHGVGAVCPPDRPDELAEVIRTALTGPRPDEHTIEKAAIALFDPERARHDWLDLIAHLEGAP
jgi:colanic acid biosynthesis glycosyl transferase WcaI